MEADTASRKLADEARKGRVRDTAIVQKFDDATFQATAAFLWVYPKVIMAHHSTLLSDLPDRSEGSLRAVTS
jgi:hypothetical protein